LQCARPGSPIDKAAGKNRDRARSVFEREMTRTEHMDFRVRHIALISLNLGNLERRIVIPP